MGLDQNLIITEHHYGDDTTDFGISNWKDITFPVAYWRKAFFIHEWFVKETKTNPREYQGGRIHVTDDILEKLYAACKEVLNIANGKTISSNLTSDPEYVFDITKLNDMYSLIEYQDDISFTEDEKEKLDQILPCDYYDCNYLLKTIKTVLMLEKVLEKTKQYRENALLYSIYYTAAF